MRDGYAANADLRMYYQVHGEPGERPPLLLIHGGGSTIESNWTNALPVLAANREVIAVEQEGHGRTLPVRRSHDLDSDVADLLAVLDALHLPTVDVLAFSAGNRAAIGLALAHPERVRRQVLASAPWRRDAMVDGFWDGLEHGTLDDMPALLRDEYLRVNPGGERLQDFFDLDVNRMLAFDGWSDEEIAAMRQPTLVVVADHDVVTVEGSVRLARAVPYGRLLVVPGNHGDFIGEAWALTLPAAAGPATMRAALELMLEFLDR